jgi:DNA-binding MarR family transcriptional regulator
MSQNESECAREILDVAPLITASIRCEMRRSRSSNLTVPPFRSLIFIGRHSGTSLSALAGHIGQSAPSMSRLVDGLVSSGLVRRTPDPGDRRRITLSLTGRGKAAMRRARDATQASIAQRVAALSPTERASVVEAMRILRGVFGPRVSVTSDDQET